jgi:hypothetical protein
MIIKNIAASLPSRIVTNEEVKDLIKTNSKQYQGDIDRALRVIDILLKKAD